MIPARLLDKGPVPPAGLWALSKAVQEHIEARGGRGADAVTLCTPRCSMVGLGYWQAMEEVDLREARRRGVAVVRRQPGAGYGAIFYPRGTLYETVVLTPRTARRLGLREDRDLLERMGEAHVETLRRLGLRARYRPLNDIETPEGRKIVAFGVHRTPRVWAASGVYVPRLDPDLAGRLITPPPEKFADKAAKSVGERVTDLRREMGRAPAYGEIRGAALSAVGEVFGLRAGPDRLLPDETRRFRAQAVLLRRRSHLHRTSDRAKFGPDLDRWRRGLLRRGDSVLKRTKLVRATVLAGNRGIVRARITGDFNASPADLVDRAEEALRGCPAGEVGERLREALRGGVLVGAGVEDVEAALRGALARALSD